MMRSRLYASVACLIASTLLASVTVHADTPAKAADIADPYEAAKKLDASQRQLLKLNAVKLLNSVAGRYRGMAEQRQALIDEYLNEKEMMAAYRAAGPPKDVEIEAKNWSETAEDGQLIPVTFAEAMDMAIEAEIEKGGVDEILMKTGSIDINSVTQQYEATEKMAKDAFMLVIKTMADVEAKASFLEDQGKLDDLISWADAKMAEQDAKAEADKAAMIDANRERLAAEQAERADRLAAVREDQARRDAEREARQAELLEKKWDRQVQSYQLRTERIKAKRSRYGYGNRYNWDDRYWYRRYRR